MVRISIAGLLGFVVAFALGLAALISGTDLWRGVACTLTLAVLLGSVLGIVLRGWRDGGLLGFALFGWGYLLMALMASGMADHLRELSDPLARWVFESSNIPPVAPPPAPPSSPGIILGSRMGNQQMTDYQSAMSEFRSRRGNATLIGHWLAVQLFAMVGAILGILLARWRRASARVAPVE
jgi:hypothetical protein